MHNTPSPSLSLIIATYNRGPRLMLTLSSLVEQTLSPTQWELVVVNNNSTDDTAAVFADFARRHPRLDARMVDEPEQGVSAARNRGVAESRGEYIVIIDDDETVVRDFLEQYRDFFVSHPAAAAAGGQILPIYESAPPAWLSSYAARAIAGTLDLGGEVRPFPDGKFFGGGNHGLRRSTIEKYGLYDTRLGRTGTTPLSGEEKELYGRLREGGETVWYLPAATIYHIINPERLSRAYFTRLCLNIGRSERVRTLAASRKAYRGRLFREAVKWGGVAALSAIYLFAGHPSKAGYLYIMRWNITRGLLGK